MMQHESSTGDGDICSDFVANWMHWNENNDLNEIERGNPFLDTCIECCSDWIEMSKTVDHCKFEEQVESSLGYLGKIPICVDNMTRITDAVNNIFNVLSSKNTFDEYVLETWSLIRLLSIVRIISISLGPKKLEAYAFKDSCCFLENKETGFVQFTLGIKTFLSSTYLLVSKDMHEKIGRLNAFSTNFQSRLIDKEVYDRVTLHLPLDTNVIFTNVAIVKGQVRTILRALLCDTNIADVVHLNDVLLFLNDTLFILFQLKETELIHS